jgi:UPF0755 protein
MRRWLVGCIVLVAVLAGGSLAGITAWRHSLQQAGPLESDKIIIVPHGVTRQVADALAADGVIAHPTVFRAAAWLSRADGTLHAAEFAFPAKPVEHRLTIAEGLTAQQIQAVVTHGDALDGDTPVIQEGTVLPQTYEYERGTTRSALVARAKAAMDKALAAAWAARTADLPLASAQELLILASIVERETAKRDERPHVAAVYLNRLRQGMKLQADPTVVYGASGGSGVLDHPLTKAELARDDPFNTYRSNGLPPAPICSPSVASLEAVAHPVSSDDLYFVADGSGGHVFSKGIEAHVAAVAKWRALPGETRVRRD